MTDSSLDGKIHATGGPGPSWHRWFLAVMVVGFTIGTLLNMAVEAKSTPEDRAVLVRTGGALGKVTGTEFGAVRGRYWPAAIVHDVAYGGTLIVPDEDSVFPPRFELLSGMTVEVEDYNPELGEQEIAELDGLPAAHTVGNLIGRADFVPIAIVWSDVGPPIPVLRLWVSDGAIYLIDDRVLSPGDG